MLPLDEILVPRTANDHFFVVHDEPSLIIIVDMSESMEKYRDKIARDIDQIVTKYEALGLNASNYEIVIIAFNTEPCEFISLGIRLGRYLGFKKDRLTFSGGTAIYYSLISLFSGAYGMRVKFYRDYSNSINSRRDVIIYTDGIDNSSYKDYCSNDLLYSSIWNYIEKGVRFHWPIKNPSEFIFCEVDPETFKEDLIYDDEFGIPLYKKTKNLNYLTDSIQTILDVNGVNKIFPDEFKW